VRRTPGQLSIIGKPTDGMRPLQKKAIVALWTRSSNSSRGVASGGVGVVLRSADIIWQARRSESPISAFGCATASRLAPGPTIFLQEAREARQRPASARPAVSSTCVLFLKRFQTLRLGDFHAAVFGFPVISVASEIPCLRQRLAAFAPASCSFRTAITCSSVNLCFFIRPSFEWPDSNQFLRKFAVAGQTSSTRRAKVAPLGRPLPAGMISTD
jgi:hypothetical protein